MGFQPLWEHAEVRSVPRTLRVINQHYHHGDLECPNAPSSHLPPPVATLRRCRHRAQRLHAARTRGRPRVSGQTGIRLGPGPQEPTDLSPADGATVTAPHSYKQSLCASDTPPRRRSPGFLTHEVGVASGPGTAGTVMQGVPHTASGPGSGQGPLPSRMPTGLHFLRAKNHFLVQGPREEGVFCIKASCCAC